MIEDEIFKKSIVVPKKLLEYGFIKENDDYIFHKPIMNHDFEIIITYSDKMRGKIIDKDLEEEYLAYRVDNNVGEFVSQIREIFINSLKDIQNKCCIENTFVFEQANRIAKLIKDKYGDIPEFLWEDDKNAVFRNQNNKKWYGIIMYINQNKLDSIDRMVEVMNIKLPPEIIDQLLIKKGYYKAYHMNKKYWISFLLDDTISDDELMKYIDISYQYTVETNDWVIPANPHYWDIIHCFDHKNIIEWKAPNSIHKGDYVYIYVGQPYSCLLYKCVVLETNLLSSYEGISSLMKIELLERYSKEQYPFELLKKYDLRAIRGARRMPNRLIQFIKKQEQN